MLSQLKGFVKMKPPIMIDRPEIHLSIFGVSIFEQIVNHFENFFLLIRRWLRQRRREMKPIIAQRR